MTPDIAAPSDFGPSDAVPTDASEKSFAEMSEAELAEWDREFLASLEAGDDSAARASLAAGVPIYYAEPDTPPTNVVKEYPDGRRELVFFDHGVETLARSL